MTYEYAAFTIGRNLRRFLHEEDATVTILAEWAEMPVNTVRNYFHGESMPSAYALHEIAIVLRKPMEDFFEEESK